MIALLLYMMLFGRLRKKIVETLREMIGKHRRRKRRKRRKMKEGGNGGRRRTGIGIGDVVVVGRVIVAAVVIASTIATVLVVAAESHLLVAVEFRSQRFGQGGRFTRSY